EAVTVLRLTNTESTVVGPAFVCGVGRYVVGVGVSVEICVESSDASGKPACSETVDEASLSPRLKIAAVETYESLQLVEDGNRLDRFNSNIRHVLVDVGFMSESNSRALRCVLELADIGQRVHSRITLELVVGDDCSRNATALVAGEDTVACAIEIVRSNSETFSASIDVPCIRGLTIAEDDVENVTETIVCWCASWSWRLETIVDCTDSVTAWCAIVRCSEEKVQTINNDLAESLPQRISSIVGDEL